MSTTTMQVAIRARLMKEAEELSRKITELLAGDISEDKLEQAYWHFESLLRISERVPVPLAKADKAIRAAEEAVETFQATERTRLYPADLKELLE